MSANIILQILGLQIYTLISSAVLFDDFNYFPDYDLLSLPHKDIRENFLANRKRNDETSKKINLLNKYLPNYTIYVDDIAHYEATKNQPDYKNVIEIENAFRDLIAMKGVKYAYKRDMFWRTWRRVSDSKSYKIVCYRCENSVNFTHCSNGGYWVIEDKPPPCPYEFFSLYDEDTICAINLEQYHDDKYKCKSTVNLGDITSICDNPVVTKWRIQKKYNDMDSERFPSVICGGRESCTISTMYKIMPDHISFMIINVTNDVMFSRIMKRGNKNYVCIKDCGKYDPNKKTINKVDKSLFVNLLASKNKREDIISKIINNKKKTKFLANQLVSKDKPKSIKHLFTKEFRTKAPSCKSVKSIVKDALDYE